MPSDVAGPSTAPADVGRRRAETLAAWEHFVAGDDEPALATVPTPILLSWRRCRDVHGLDPLCPRGRSPRPQGLTGPLRNGGIFAQLGAVAATVVHDVGGCVATVTDADAQVLASWSGAGAASACAPFELQSRWPESIGGTNGMGTALLQAQPIAVRGPEHWRQDLHEWNSLGMAVHDPVADRPVGVLNVAARTEAAMAGMAERLAAELEPARRYLRNRARHDALAVAERFSVEMSRRSGTALGLDLAGNIVAAAEAVREAVGIPAGFLLDAESRRVVMLAPLRAIAEQSFEKALADPTWTGSALLGPPITDTSRIYAVLPVTGPSGLAGWILCDEGDAGGSAAVLDGVGHRSLPGAPGRIAAVAGDSVLLLSPDEIRFAEANRHILWLTTDWGRFRAVTKGMDRLEQELRRYGFIRVHRSYLINPARVCRVVHKGGGVITLSTDHHRPENIPVSRRSTQEVRHRLGL